MLSANLVSLGKSNKLHMVLIHPKDRLSYCCSKYKSYKKNLIMEINIHTLAQKILPNFSSVPRDVEPKDSTTFSDNSTFCFLVLQQITFILHHMQ